MAYWDTEDREDGVEEDEGVDDGFEDAVLFAASHSELPLEVLKDIQTNNDYMKRTLPYESLQEAISAATLLQRVCGDSDGWIAEQTQTIISNLAATVEQLTLKPERLITTKARGQSSPELAIEVLEEARKFIDEAILEFKSGE